MLRIISLLVGTGFCLAVSASRQQSEKITAEKIIRVIVDETGTITVGRDTVSADNLALYIQERLFKSYLGTGKMYDRIIFEKINEKVADIVADVVQKEILEGQKRALRQLCTQKFNKMFDNLEERKQDKLKKQFPVLFQTDYL